MPKIANLLLPVVLKVPGITPNKISIFGFIVFLLGCSSLFWIYPYHLYLAALLLLVSYILDCLDGQVARTMASGSSFGSFLDKSIDFLKVFIVTASLAWSVYLINHHIIYIWLAYIAAFFFSFRYYIKYITMFSEIVKDKDYLDRSKILSEDLYVQIEHQRTQLAKTFLGKIKVLWLMNKPIFEVEEAELIIFTAIGAMVNRLDIVLWILGVIQVLIVTWRLFIRGYQVEWAPEQLLSPIKK
jgi:phosphatidylglycerophosphate synthase